MRCMCYIPRASVCAAHARARPDENWHALIAFSQQNVCRWHEESCFCVCVRACVCAFEGLFSEPVGVGGPEFFIPRPRQVQKVQGFVFYPPAAWLHFVVQDFLRCPVFFELQAGCYWDSTAVVTACVCVCVSVWVLHWSLKKHFHIGRDWWCVFEQLQPPYMYIYAHTQTRTDTDIPCPLKLYHPASGSISPLSAFFICLFSQPLEPPPLRLARVQL